MTQDQLPATEASPRRKYRLHWLTTCLPAFAVMAVFDLVLNFVDKSDFQSYNVYCMVLQVLFTAALPGVGLWRRVFRWPDLPPVEIGFAATFAVVLMWVFWRLILLLWMSRYGTIRDRRRVA
jgi:hypothetical protein